MKAKDEVGYAQHEMVSIIQSYTDWRADTITVCYGPGDDEINAWCSIDGETIMIEDLRPEDGVDANRASLGMVMFILGSEVQDARSNDNDDRTTIVMFVNRSGCMTVTKADGGYNDILNRLMRSQHNMRPHDVGHDQKDCSHGHGQS